MADENGIDLPAEIAEALGEPESPPRLDEKAEKKLLKRLQKATELARKRKISDLHHAAIGLDTVMRLYGDAGRGPEYSIRGRRFSTFDSASTGWATLMHRTGLDFAAAVEEYGGFTGYVARLRDYQGHSRELGPAEIEWDAEMEQILGAALIRLSPLGRSQFKIEEWLQDQERFFPKLSSLFSTAVVAIAAAVIGALLARGC